MDLRGWDYTGRNIGPDLHRQFSIMIECLSDPEFTNHSTWNNALQERLAPYMNMSSAGAVRTVKRVCANFGLIVEESFGNRQEIDSTNLLTKRGKLVYQAAKLESQVNESDRYDENTKEKINIQIKNLYEEAYCSALTHYYFSYNDNRRLHPLRATLLAIKKYGTLDKWEWYLLNICVRHDDDLEEIKDFDTKINEYRKGQLSFSMEDVVEKPKGHQYIPQYFEFAGLMHVIQRPEWSISDSGRHKNVKDIILEQDFLDKLYGGVYDE